MEAEDSDATEEEQELSQVLESPGGSPSILHPQEHVCVPNRRDIVPCSSDEGTDDVLSQEYPPPAAAVQQLTSDSQRTTAPSHQALSQVEEKQASLMSEVSTVLSSYGEMLPLNFVRNAKESMSVLEGKLKEISQAHQSERKCLASVHTQLSQGTSSQEGGGGGGGQSLRSQLLSLSSRQKRLLECFKKQKEISLKVGELLEREVKAKKTVESSVKDKSSSATSIYLPNLAKHLISCSQSKPTSSSGHSPPTTTTPTSDTPNPVNTPATKTLAQTQLRLANPTQTRPRPTNPIPTSGTRTATAPQSTLPHPPQQDGSSQAVQPTPLSGSSGGGGGGSGGGGMRALGSELTQPVPLSTLVQHQLLPPGSVLTCTVLGCQFRASLSEDGGLREVHTQGSPGFGGQEPPHQQPQQWLRSCWSRLGHCHKKISKKQAYNTILCGGKPLSHYCERYSRQQVSRYLNHKRTSGTPPNVNGITAKQQSALSAPMNSTLGEAGAIVNAAACPDIQPDTRAAFNPDTLLSCGQVLLVSSDYHSRKLPAGFWQEGRPLPSHMLQQMAMDLNR